jgi:hypothetical protein
MRELEGCGQVFIVSSLLSRLAKGFSVDDRPGHNHLFTSLALLYLAAPGGMKSFVFEGENLVRILKTAQFVPCFVGMFSCNCRNGLGLLVLGGERHAKH